MNRLKLFGMNAKQSWFVVVFFLIDLLVIGLVVLTVIFGWDYTAAILSSIWRFVTVDIPRLIIAVVSAIFMILFGILSFFISLAGKPGHFPSPRLPFRRSYRFPKPRISFPSRTRTSMRLSEIKIPEITSPSRIETSIQLSEIKPSRVTNRSQVEIRSQLHETEQPEITSPSRFEANSQLQEAEQPDTTSPSGVDNGIEPTGIEPPEIESYLSRLLKLLRKLKIKWPRIDWGSGWSSGQGSGWPSGYYRSTHVRGYFRRDGTYVSGHSRRGYYRGSRRW